MLTVPLRFWVFRIIFLLLLGSGIVLLGWTIVRSAVGDGYMIVVQRSPNLSIEAQIKYADAALRYSPHDPLIHWRRGGVYLKAVNEEMTESRLEVALDELRTAARMSPGDYRVWLALGRVLDRGGSTAEARQAFEHAVELAPNHFDPRWALGNLLLRSGDRDGSFAQMRLALSNKPSAFPLVFDYAWEVYQGDARAIAAALDPPHEVQAQMVAMLIYRGRVDDAFTVWSGMHSRTPNDALKVAEALFNTGHFKISFDVWNSVEIADRPAPDPGSVLTNGGFESTPALNEKTPFLTWQIKPFPGTNVTLDRKEPREGRQSLRIRFDVKGNVAFTIAAQTVPAKPSTSYRLTFSVKSEELMSLSTPIIEIFDSAFDLTGGNRVRIATKSLPNGTKEWTDYALDFTTGAQTEAVTVRIQRLPCSEPPCPIEGLIWFDQFKLAEKGKIR